MNIDEIKRNAPCGASHYAYYDLGDFPKTIYYKYIGVNLYVYNSIFDEWKLDKVKKTANFKKRLKPL